MIIDIMVLPSNEYFILDEDELPEPLVQFESGYVKEVLNVLTDTIHVLLPRMILETETIFKEKGVYLHTKPNSDMCSF